MKCVLVAVAATGSKSVKVNQLAFTVAFRYCCPVTHGFSLLRSLKSFVFHEWIRWRAQCTCARTQPASEWERFWGENVWPTPILPVSSCWSFSGVSKYFSTRIIPLQLVSGVWFGVFFSTCCFVVFGRKLFNAFLFLFPLESCFYVTFVVFLFSFEARQLAVASAMGANGERAIWERSRARTRWTTARSSRIRNIRVGIGGSVSDALVFPLPSEAW